MGESVPTPSPADPGPPGDNAGQPVARRLDIPDGVFRFLLVSPAHFTAAFERPDFELTVVFRSFDRRSGGRMAFDGPYARSTMMLSFEVSVPDKKLAIVIPQYHHVGEEVSALISAFYGKFVINAGQMQSGDRLTVPNMWDGPCYTFDHPAFNERPRKPDGPELQLTHVAPLLDVYFYNQVQNETLDRILRAAEFYRMALENFHERPEMSFTLLISALEALIDLRSYTDEEKYDPQTIAQLAQIAAQCTDGPQIVANLKGRLFQIRRRIAQFVDAYVPDQYFVQTEAREAWAVVKNREDLKARVLSSYDLRSKLLHTGNRTGLDHLTQSAMGEEFMLGRLRMPDEKMADLLMGCLTLAGLERVTSTVLRTAIQRHLLPSSTPAS